MVQDDKQALLGMMGYMARPRGRARLNGALEMHHVHFTDGETEGGGVEGRQSSPSQSAASSFFQAQDYSLRTLGFIHNTIILIRNVKIKRKREIKHRLKCFCRERDGSYLITKFIITCDLHSA